MVIKMMRKSIEAMAAAKGLSRRDFIKAVAAGTVAVSAVSMLGACSTPSAPEAKGTGGGHEGETYANLNTAVDGETNAYTKYDAFAKKAEADGYPQVARLFRATADAERIHAGDEFDLAYAMDITAVEATPGEPAPGTTAENLQTAIDGETYEYSEMYPEFLKIAEEEKLDAAAKIFNRALQAEKCHAVNYKKYLDNLDNLEEENIYLCPTCGYIMLGVNEGTCPVCLVNAKAFRKY